MDLEAQQHKYNQTLKTIYKKAWKLVKPSFDEQRFTKPK